MLNNVILIVLLSTGLVYADNCDDLNDKRGESLNTTIEAFNCYDDLLKSDGLSRLEQASTLNNMSYLKFFEASFYSNDRLKSLKSSFELAQDAIKKFTPIFNTTDARVLESREIDSVALSYYLYGTSLSLYVDLKGKWEAIKRMAEIKKTMKMILSLKKPETFHYGAYRTLAIFNLKVPKIAGGSIKKSGKFFQKLIKESMTDLGVMSYPAGHIFYADYLVKTGKKSEACLELEKLINLPNSIIDESFYDLRYETRKDIETAKAKFEKFNC